MILIRYLCFVVLLTACSSATDKSSQHCPVSSNRDWQMSLIELSPERYHLTVIGKVDLPTPGYSIHWQSEITHRRIPPELQLDLTAIKRSNKVVIQQVTTQTTRFEQAGAHAAYSAIHVFCHGRHLHTFSQARAQLQ